MKLSKQWDIEVAMVVAGALHFLYSCGRGCLVPFLTLYLRHLGLSAYMVGIVMGTRHLISLIWHPLSSLLARHHDKRRAVIIGSLVCSAGLGLAFLLLPPTGEVTGVSVCNSTAPLVPRPTADLSNSLPVDHRPVSPGIVTAGVLSKERLTMSAQHLTGMDHVGNAITTIAQGSSESGNTSPSVSVNVVRREKYSRGIMDVNNSNGYVAPHRRAARSQTQDEVEEEAHFEFLGSLKGMDAQHQLFFLVLIVMGLWELVATPLEWTADDGLYEYLDFVDATEHHGRVWMWRLLGGACGVFGAGLLVSNLGCFLFGGASVPRSAVHFFGYALLMLVTIPEAIFLPLYLNRKQVRQRGRRTNNGVKALRVVKEDPRALLCAITACLVGVAGAAVEDFLPWQMQDHGSSEMHIGVALGMALLFQVVFPPLLRTGLVSRLLGPHGRLLLMGTASRALQCLYYSFLWGPWSVLPAQALDFLSVSAFWWSLEAQCKDVATPGTERAIQRIYQALALDLGAGLGSFAGGMVVQRFGVAVLFQGLAASLALWCLVLGLLQWKIPRQRRINYSRLLAADASQESDSETDQERDWLDKAIEEENGNNSNSHRNKYR
ncbi:major facilitator superfamily domain-containing protein 6-like [Clupea harengus]|uniref:Major facilitator superfamily domain-containing protein 6-like n=1 Tax=Clupea harengus TaxID=7950 RepID=A0A6P3VTV7_CLUHA|nr:major facilitator superfamily domain-containing protein 6-like [Clupea harengus]